MTYTQKEYAEAAAQANSEGKILSVVDGNLVLSDPPMAGPEMRIAEIRTRLTEIDLESVRPLRAMAAGEATEADTAKLSTLASEASALRQELATLAAQAS